MSAQTVVFRSPLPAPLFAKPLFAKIEFQDNLKEICSPFGAWAEILTGRGTVIAPRFPPLAQIQDCPHAGSCVNIS